ncbi:hypothetical protein BN7_3475 [Wickerhamomyces ciferrii]|uniref:F-box domain-containing protein n=1 Tax=Wickerhamomyces ciferrii (strain ATCC 14091 / BCRC 22168 / CBS 111 / JCM 3599 / NBRC 0793 / NRRL Y-1031 F-60-10) TaxID=1206466 RepID=K0KFL0_WICCF|nr:uncharacterized protein BN7_3475 [Wickerhamomyces ciferrii]CCH43920.1 hypothetical protein BN7_3475 [Wickerhamomyces ciferrii]
MYEQNDYLQLLKNLPFELFLRVLDNLNPMDLKNYIQMPNLYHELKHRYKIIQWPPEEIHPNYKDVFMNLKDIMGDDDSMTCLSRFKGLIFIIINKFGGNPEDLLFDEFALMMQEKVLKFEDLKLYFNMENILDQSPYVDQLLINHFCTRILKYKPNIFQYCLLPGLKKLETLSGLWRPDFISKLDFTQYKSNIDKDDNDHTVKFMGGLETLCLEGVLRTDVLESKIPLFPPKLFLYQLSITPPITNKCFQNIVRLELNDITDETFGFIELPNLVRLLISGSFLSKVSNLKAINLKSLVIRSYLENASLELLHIETPQIKKLELCCETFHSAQFVTSLDTLEEVTIYQGCSNDIRIPIINLENLLNDQSPNPFTFASSVKKIRVGNTIPIFTNLHFPNLESLTILGEEYGYNSYNNQIHYIPGPVNELIFTSVPVFNNLCYLGRPGINKVQIIVDYMQFSDRQGLNFKGLSKFYPNVETLILKNCLLPDMYLQENHSIKKLDISFSNEIHNIIHLNFEKTVLSQLRKLKISRLLGGKVHPYCDSILFRHFEAAKLEDLIMENVFLRNHFSTLTHPMLKKLYIPRILSLDIASSEILEEVYLDGEGISCFRGLTIGQLPNIVEFHPPKNMKSRTMGEYQIYECINPARA